MNRVLVFVLLFVASTNATAMDDFFITLRDVVIAIYNRTLQGCGATNGTQVTVPTMKPPLAKTTKSKATTTISRAVTTRTGGCCPHLTQTLGSAHFVDGTMTFKYDSNSCPTSVVVTCGRVSSDFDLNAAIVANSGTFLSIAANTVSFSGTCNSGVWNMGNPPLKIETISCVLN